MKHTQFPGLHSVLEIFQLRDIHCHHHFMINRFNKFDKVSSTTIWSGGHTIYHADSLGGFHLTLDKHWVSNSCEFALVFLEIFVVVKLAKQSNKVTSHSTTIGLKPLTRAHTQSHTNYTLNLQTYVISKTEQDKQVYDVGPNAHC